jgi:hypothetical protein
MGRKSTFVKLHRKENHCLIALIFCLPLTRSLVAGYELKDIPNRSSQAPFLTDVRGGVPV